MPKIELRPVGLAQTAILVERETQCQRPSSQLATGLLLMPRPERLFRGVLRPRGQANALRRDASRLGVKTRAALEESSSNQQSRAP